MLAGDADRLGVTLTSRRFTMPRFAANLSMMYNEHAFFDRFSAAARDGFKAVEFLFKRFRQLRR